MRLRYDYLFYKSNKVVIFFNVYMVFANLVLLSQIIWDTVMIHENILKRDYSWFLWYEVGFYGNVTPGFYPLVQ